jgi:acyl-CoA thioester hydrolase
MPARPFVIDEYVRWSDVDFAGIIFYGAYVRFFEIAETELFREAGLPYGEVFDRFDIWLPRAHLDCDFKYPARLDDRLRVAVYFTRFGTSSIGINFDVVMATKHLLAAAGHEVLVCTDRKTLKPRPLPGALRSLLEPFACTEAQAREHLGLANQGGEAGRR